MPDSTPILDKITECWRSGLGIRATILAVRRCLGVALDAEQVRTRFVALSWGCG